MKVRRKDLELWEKNTFIMEKNLHEKLGYSIPFEGNHINEFLEWFEGNMKEEISLDSDFLDSQYEEFLNLN